MPQRKRNRNGASVKVHTPKPPVSNTNRNSFSQAPSRHKRGKRHQEHLIADNPVHSALDRPRKRICNITSAASQQQTEKLPGIPKVRTPVTSLCEPAVSGQAFSASGIARLQAVDATTQRLWQEAIAQRRPVSTQAVAYAYTDTGHAMVLMYRLLLKAICKMQGGKHPPDGTMSTSNRKR